MLTRTQEIAHLKAIRIRHEVFLLQDEEKNTPPIAFERIASFTQLDKKSGQTKICINAAKRKIRELGLDKVYGSVRTFNSRTEASLYLGGDRFIKE